ncbi:hypothetical protein, partial [Stutzerimonas nitrititolerans]|uniref:hypothetical protein n=1 Tax=Stutzerimonas nitrititolerans TaxID=2482751 RepID=UPI0028A2CBA6
MSHSDITHSPLRNSIVQHTTLAFILVIGVTLCSMLGGMYMADSIQGTSKNRLFPLKSEPPPQG